jgi:hypothetical protein
VSGLLRFLLFFALLVGLLVFVALPALASPLLGQLVRDAGLQADRLSVSVPYFDPGLIVGQPSRLRLEAGDVELGPATAAGLDLTLGEVDLLGRTFESVRGNVRDTELTAGGLNVAVDRIDIEGPATQARVTAHFAPDQAADILRQSARRVGVALDDVRLVDDAVRLRVAGFEARATVAVEGGALVLRAEHLPALLLLQPAPSEPWRLTEASVSSDGLTVSGVVDAAALARVARESR